jgi:murein DD-endopeptidase MepM/ murein hydrolase activator NlpD
MNNGLVRAATKGARASILLAGLVWPASSQALDNPGGTAAPPAIVPTRGTGGTAYAAVSPKSRVVNKPVKRPAPRHTTPKPTVPRSPAPKPTPVPSGVPSPAQTAALGAFFPVRWPHSFGDAANRFGAGRAGHIHQGQDVLAGEGLSVVAPLAGTIITTGNQAGGAGWYVAEQAADGLAFFYAHCQAGSVAVIPEQSVRAGQQLCRVGQTGDATGPHLHFEVWVGGWRTATGYPIDPLPYLEAWTR